MNKQKNKKIIDMESSPPRYEGRKGKYILGLTALFVLVFFAYHIDTGVAITGAATEANPMNAVLTVPDANNSVNVVQDAPGSYQEIRMNVTNAGWIPNKFVLKKGVPVKWVIDGQELNGCNSGIQVPSLGLRFSIKPGLQTIKFTPKESGTIKWSCFMGMMQGAFIVKDEVNDTSAEQVQKDLNSVNLPTAGGSCGGGGGGCGCGRGL